MKHTPGKNIFELRLKPLNPVRPMLPLLPVLVGSGLAVAQGLDSHVHGEAELNVVVAGQQLQAEFLSPAMNFLGFEHTPASGEESELYDAVLTTLLTDGSWLTGNALGACEASTVAFEAPQFADATHEHDGNHNHEEHHENHGSHEHGEHHEHHGSHEHGEHHEHHGSHEHGEDHGHAEADGHADFRVQYLYDCPGSPPREIRLTAFEHYPGIEIVTVQWIAGRQQGFAELSAGNPILNLE